MIVHAVYDLLCPWSLVAKRCFEEAVRRSPPRERTVRWEPFMLYPQFERGGHDFLAFFRSRYGDELKVPMWDAIRAVAEPLGIRFAFERIERGPASIDTHRLVRLASREVPGREGQVYETVARAFFEGARVVDEDLLVEVGVGAGLDADRTRTYLRGREDEAAIFAETDAWRRAGVTGMPHYILRHDGGRTAVVNSPSVAAFEAALAPV